MKQKHRLVMKYLYSQLEIPLLGFQVYAICPVCFTLVFTLVHVKLFKEFGTQILSQLESSFASIF